MQNNVCSAYILIWEKCLYMFEKKKYFLADFHQIVSVLFEIV